MLHFNLHKLQSLLPPEAAPGIVRNCFETLAETYGQPWRHYHATWHIDDCLGLLETHRSLARDPRTLALAVFFHDLVCEPGALDNEAASAEVAALWLARCREHPAAIDVVRRLILATAKHRVEPDGPEDSGLMVDIDLASLASPPEVFDHNTELIGREFQNLESQTVIEGRIRFLEAFLARDYVYQTETFRAAYEEKARANLSRSLGRLRAAST
jgi:predicted metal-dependent HD superfamily phosphohydrolase